MIQIMRRRSIGSEDWSFAPALSASHRYFVWAIRVTRRTEQFGELLSVASAHANSDQVHPRPK